MQLFSTLLDINSTLTPDVFVKLVFEWIATNYYEENRIPGIESLTWTGQQDIHYGDDNLWVDIENYSELNIIAVRFEKKQDDGVIWNTDYVMNFDDMKMSVRLDRSYTDNTGDGSAVFSTPYFISLLIDRGFLKDDHGLPVLAEFTSITSDNLGLLADVINGVDRYDLSVVYVSKTLHNEDPVNIKKLAYYLKGIAHVLVQESTSTNQDLRNLCDSKNDYYGAIGIYFPKIGLNPVKHLFRGNKGYDDAQMQRVISTVIQYNNASLVDTLYTWQGVKNAQLRDNLNKQIEGRRAAEEAKKAAEKEAAKVHDILNEEEITARKEAMEVVYHEFEEIRNGFYDEMKNYKKQLSALTKGHEELLSENQALKQKLVGGDAEPVLYMGEETENYPGEVRDILIKTLKNACTTNANKKRRIDILRDILAKNEKNDQA